MGRIRLTSGGSFTLPPTITSINGRLMSETTDQGIVISPKGADGDEFEFTEKVNSNFFKVIIFLKLGFLRVQDQSI
jgi:hypothetical protein